jgi:succinyl-diaminopimelate desuccinylase
MGSKILLVPTDLALTLNTGESSVAIVARVLHSGPMIFTDAHADEIGRTVSELVSIKSLSGEEKPAADYVVNYLKQIGITADRDEDDNVVAVIEPQISGDPKQNTIHLSGHTDTVVPVEGWQTDPWKPVLSGSGDERRIVGLGTSDMKSGLATMLHLARFYMQPGNRPQRLRIVISFTICEERPANNKCNGVAKVLPRYPGRWALTTEASCDYLCPTIAVGCQGHAVAIVTLQGRSAHSASPERGLNAIHAAGKISTRVEALNRSFKEIAVLGEVQARAAAAVTMIRGGTAGNIIPEFCELTISRRIAPGETVETVERDLTELTRDLDGVTATWKVRNDAPACVVDVNGPLLKCASQASNHLFNAVRYSWNRARTDMVLFKQAGMDVLNIGPGFSGQAHVAGEYVRLIDLPRSASLVHETLRLLDQWLVTNPNA